MTVFVDGADLSVVDEFVRKRFPKAVQNAQILSCNDTARKALVIGKQRILREVNFPQDYLNEPERFYISQFAVPGRPEAHVTGRSRPTSLLRFAVGNPTPASTRGVRGQKGVTASGGAPGVQVSIKPGDTTSMASAFVISLNGGNYGLAVRIPKGGALPSYLNKRVFVQEATKGGYYILYGPSVDQVWRGVAQDIAPQIGELFQAEFVRQLGVQVAGGN